MSVWILVISILASDGSTAVKLLNASTAEKNSREVCLRVGKQMNDKLYESFGKDKITVIWGCQEMTKEEFDRALPPSI